jgi:hypothetical protein
MCACSQKLSNPCCVVDDEVGLSGYEGLQIAGRPRHPARGGWRSRSLAQCGPRLRHTAARLARSASGRSYTGRASLRPVLSTTQIAVSFCVLPSGRRCNGPSAAPICYCRRERCPRWNAPPLIRALASGARQRRCERHRSGRVSTLQVLILSSYRPAWTIFVN